MPSCYIKNQKPAKCNNCFWCFRAPGIRQCRFTVTTLEQDNDPDLKDIKLVFCHYQNQYPHGASRSKYAREMGIVPEVTHYSTLSFQDLKKKILKYYKTDQKMVKNPRGRLSGQVTLIQESNNVILENKFESLKDLNAFLDKTFKIKGDSGKEFKLLVKRTDLKKFAYKRKWSQEVKKNGIDQKD
jgi:hypothetical protein